MKISKLKRTSGGVLMAIGLITYSVYWVCQYILDTVPDWLFWICTCVFAVGVGLGLILILTKKDDELDMDMKKTMDERRYDAR